MVGSAVYTLLAFALTGALFNGSRHGLFTTNPDGTTQVSNHLVALQLASTPMSLLGLAFVGLLIAWIYQAGKFAEMNGWPTVRNRTLGAFSILIPIVNFWFPYQAIRDCLPLDDPNRARILQWWLAYMVGEVVGGAAFIAAFFSSGTAAALSIPAAVLWIAVLAFAPRVVTSVTVAHREALAR